MNKKTRNGRVSLYRSHYVRKGVVGNSHGYSSQEFVGSLPADAIDIPAELVAKMSAEEIEYVETKVVIPARRAAEQARLVAEAERRALEIRERDPRWRLDEALRYLTDACKLVSEPGPRIDAARVTALRSALDKLSLAAKVQRDPLDAVLAAVASATAAVKGGHYGSAPGGNVRDTAVYKSWRNIGEAVDTGKDSLLRALQAKGWARVRG